MKLRKIIESFVILYVLIILVVGIFNGIGDGYNLIEQNLQDDKNIFQKLAELNLIAGINDLTIGIQRLGELSNPLDLVGALALSGMGALQIVGGVVTFPLEIFGIITGFYDNIIPPIITQFFGIMIVLIIAFIILKAKLGNDLED